MSNELSPVFGLWQLLNDHGLTDDADAYCGPSESLERVAQESTSEVRRGTIPREDVVALFEAARELLSIDDGLCSVPTDADFVTAYLRGDEARAKLRALISKRGAQ